MEKNRLCRRESRFSPFPSVGEGADDIKVGYVDLQVALNTSSAGQKAKDSFKAEVGRMERRLEKRGKKSKSSRRSLRKSALTPRRRTDRVAARLPPGTARL